jgi:hypothetical protein
LERGIKSYVLASGVSCRDPDWHGWPFYPWEQVGVHVITGIFAAAFIPLAAWSTLAGLYIILWLCIFIILAFIWLWDYSLYFIRLKDEIATFGDGIWGVDLDSWRITALIEKSIWADYGEKFFEPTIKLFGLAVALFGLCRAFFCD